jgi:hypothetical protein
VYHVPLVGCVGSVTVPEMVVFTRSVQSWYVGPMIGIFHRLAERTGDTRDRAIRSGAVPVVVDHEGRAAGVLCVAGLIGGAIALDQRDVALK